VIARRLRSSQYSLLNGSDKQNRAEALWSKDRSAMHARVQISAPRFKTGSNLDLQKLFSEMGWCGEAGHYNTQHGFLAYRGAHCPAPAHRLRARAYTAARPRHDDLGYATGLCGRGRTVDAPRSRQF